MVTNYTIYLVNRSASTKTFWSFLQPPNELDGQPGVFANSSAQLAVASNAGSINKFVIPVQYVIGAGASNKAVGLNTKVISDFTQNTDLGQAWLANYKDAPPPMGPDVVKGSNPTPEMITVAANNFNKVENEALQWYGNMSFGIQTSAGYMGMTWSPDPGDTRTISPKLSFYVSTGTFGENELAAWTTINSKAAAIELTDFSNREVTVTLTETGTWEVTPGRPSSLQAAESVQNLMRSHRALSDAHFQLTSFLTAAGGSGGQLTIADGLNAQADVVESVVWDSHEGGRAMAYDVDLTYLSGTLSVGTALAAGFAAFVLGGVRFQLISAHEGDTQVRFSYSGAESARCIKDLFKAGAEIFLTN